MQDMNGLQLITKTIDIFKNRNYSEENVNFLRKLSEEDDTNLRILSSRFFKFSPSDYAIASILVTDDVRVANLKSNILNSISDDRKEFLSDLIFQFS